MIKLGFVVFAIFGVVLVWATALDAPHLRSARFAGRTGWALFLLALVAFALAGCADLSAAARYCLQHPDHCR